MTIGPSIVDLHCDLLGYLQQGGRRTPYDECVRCSIPQLQAGGVKFQTMAIFTDTEKDSCGIGAEQYQLFRQLGEKYSDAFELVQGKKQLLDLDASQRVRVVLAVENASSFCNELEPLEKGLARLEEMQSEVAKILYISLTWNHENRFGGGALTQIGLKEDGKRLLEFMDSEGIAVDLSHTSDHLAHEILEHIDTEGLTLPVLASHSNFRAITNVPRNLPEAIAREILLRKGVIGLTFIKDFIGGTSFDNFAKHVAHLIELGGDKQGCLGGDFFSDNTVPPQYRKPQGHFFKDYDNASIYPKALELCKRKLGLSSGVVNGIAHGNFQAFIKRFWREALPARPSCQCDDMSLSPF